MQRQSVGVQVCSDQCTAKQQKEHALNMSARTYGDDGAVTRTPAHLASHSERTARREVSCLACERVPRGCNRLHGSAAACTTEVHDSLGSQTLHIGRNL